MWIWGNKIEFCIKSSGFFDKVYMDIRQTNWLYTESEPVSYTHLVSFFRNQRLRYRLKDILRPCKDLVMEFLRISVPVMLSDSLLG